MKSKYYNFLILCATLLLFSGCVKEANLSFIAPQIIVENNHFSVYDATNDRITFYYFYKKEGKMVVEEWSKILPFRVEFMDLWVTGLGHDLRRLTEGKAETIKDALMYGAQKQGMRSLHVNQNDYILDNQFANDMVSVIRAYEEKMERYNRDRDFPFLLRRF
ncbi:MAG: hypothetical protein J0647_03675 [Campylobacteraceae bacterium]|nr:hypothetical protein [Campylobacteraceae bacterium]